MIGGLVSAAPSVRRFVAATALATVILVGGAGTYMVLRSTCSNDCIIEKFERPLKGGLDSASGATVGYVTSSGSLAFSGRTMTVSDGFTGTGRIILNSTQGGVFCMPNTSGTMKAIIINNATVTVRAPEGGECTQ